MYRLDEILSGQSAADLPETERRALREVARWMDAHISRPHAMLGRSGDVCPWTRRAAELGGLSLEEVGTEHTETLWLRGGYMVQHVPTPCSDAGGQRVDDDADSWDVGLVARLSLIHI